MDYDPPSYNNVAYHSKGASPRLQTLIIDHGPCLRAHVLDAGEYMSQLEAYLYKATAMTDLRKFKSLERLMAPSQAFVSLQKPANNGKKLRVIRVP